MIPFVPTPTLVCDVTRGHAWLRYGNEALGIYNVYDCLFTALARRKLPEILDQSGNRQYHDDWWFKRVSPVALNIQRRGFGHLDWDAWRAKQRELLAEIGEIETKLLDSRSEWQELLDAAEEWRREHEAKDWADALAKNAKRKRPKPESELKLTRETQRRNGYKSRVRKAREAREKFLNSPQAKARWLFDELGLKPAPKARKRPERSTGKHALLHIYRKLTKRQREQYGWVLEDLFHRAGLNTILTRYIGRDSRYPPFAVAPDGRIYYHLRTYAAETLRWSPSEPAFHQWPPSIRNIIRAAPGKRFVSADWSGFEVRILALYAQETKDLEVLADPTRDIHYETAWDLFPGLREKWDTLADDVKRQYKTRVKNFRFERNYGGSGLGASAKVFCPCPRCVETVPDTGEITPADMKRAALRYSVVRGRTDRWQSETLERVKREGRRWRCPVGGYVRQFLRPGDEIKTEMANYPMQHTGAAIRDRALVKLDELGAPVVFEHHDEIILEVDDTPEAEERAKAQLSEAMMQPIPELGGAVFPIGFYSGYTWGDLK